MVLNTIVDNIRSFFEKEERLLQDPQQVPDAASEVLGDAQPVVEQPLPKEATPQTETFSETSAPGLPFSAQELQSALQQKQQSRRQEAQRPDSAPQAIQPHEIHELESEYVSDEDLLAFEESVSELNTPDVTPAIAHSRVAQRQAVAPLKDGFFSSFEDFIASDSLEKTHLDGDLLHKMRTFHQRRHEGKEPLLSQRSAQDALKRRLGELQSLEHEWERLYAESRDTERAMIHVEGEIEEKSKALRSLVEESEHLSLLSQEVSADQAFVLSNGARVRSLGGLLRAVRNERWLFDQHVSTRRNDFAVWASSVLGNEQLAARLQSAVTFDQFLDVLRSA